MSQRVLVIDDSQSIHALVRARLAHEAVELAGATNGLTGLRAALESPPDLILLDVDLPDIDGFEVCRRLKSSSATVNVPIIFLTGASSTDEKIKGLELGAVDYVTKPFDPAELRARVRSSLRSKYLFDLLARKAMIDGLTGLSNRSYFDRRMSEEVARARRIGTALSCILADVDHFKSFNDRFGHLFGDELLRRIATALTDTVREEDVVCRYGGEEFAIISPNCGGDGATSLAERLRSAVACCTLSCREEPVNVTASFGVAGSDDIPFDQLVEQADAALYRAKRSGRNRVERAGGVATPA